MEIDTKAPEGNAFAIMGVVQKLLRDTGRADEIKAAMERMESGDYQNLCDVATEVSHGSITFVSGGDDD